MKSYPRDTYNSDHRYHRLHRLPYNLVPRALFPGIAGKSALGTRLVSLADLLSETTSSTSFFLGIVERANSRARVKITPPEKRRHVSLRKNRG